MSRTFRIIPSLATGSTDNPTTDPFLHTLNDDRVEYMYYKQSKTVTSKVEAAVPIEVYVPLSLPPGNQSCNYCLQLLDCWRQNKDIRVRVSLLYRTHYVLAFFCTQHILVIFWNCMILFNHSQCHCILVHTVLVQYCDVFMPCSNRRDTEVCKHTTQQ
jgi:hypothetical protein